LKWFKTFSSIWQKHWKNSGKIISKTVLDMAGTECMQKFSAQALWMWSTFMLAGAEDPTPGASRNVLTSLSRIHKILGQKFSHL